ncbi:CMF_HP2_G0012140.mRNA.1.CDS.1 [Saccharomyces cerevisiae]|nr:CMF_HP2_G0012140.mRNA.1.CDS.1 [Saccharomyces cerevisiae]CAI6443113.1 CMF_HP2_G0012140.mRNA.1.CDS.1 [Saccharomyces cerevisiae]
MFKLKAVVNPKPIKLTSDIFIMEKKEIANLEKELETVLKVKHDNVNRLFGYTVERMGEK